MPILLLRCNSFDLTSIVLLGKNYPPLIKGHLRIGGFVGDGAVVDLQFNPTDVSIIVKTNLITKNYFRHYERSANCPPR